MVLAACDEPGTRTPYLKPSPEAVEGIKKLQNYQNPIHLVEGIQFSIGVHQGQTIEPLDALNWGLPCSEAPAVVGWRAFRARGLAAASILESRIEHLYSGGFGRDPPPVSSNPDQ